MTVDPALELADVLLQLEPVRTYPTRAAEKVARHLGAESFRLELTDGRVEGGERSTGTRSVAVPLSNGKDSLGTLHLSFPAGMREPSEDDRRRMALAAGVLTRGLEVARRLAPDVLRRTNEAVAQTLRKAPLTPRERDVVGLLVSGASTRTIATSTGLTISTVNTYLKRIFSKLGVHSRVELVARMAGTVATAPPVRRPGVVGGVA